MVTGERVGDVPFLTHVELLQLFLASRAEIVEAIQAVLNAQRQPHQYLQDRALLSRRFEDCFFTLAAVSDAQSRLRRQLEEAHWGSGFTPREIPELHNDIVDPAEMLVRGFHCWRQTRWPGRNGRVRYAHSLFNLQVIRRLVLLSMRVWDAGPDSARARLAHIQTLLDELWRSTPADQPVLVRDARWLIPLAQSPTTDALSAYLEVAQLIAKMPTQADRLEIQKAHVLMIGGHLRSQARHYCLKDGVSLDEESVIRRTRSSNALDFALLIHSLVPLLETYEHAGHSGDVQTRLELASAICQAISADPELFVNRTDLLGAYSMIEPLFVGMDADGYVAYTPMGQRHVQLLEEFKALISRLAKSLHDDCPHFKPLGDAYSPYGAIFGTPTNLIEDMALKTLQRDAVTHLGLEDVFADGDAQSGKLAWINGWRKLPHVPQEVQALYAYPQQFAEAIYARIELELHKHIGASDAKDTPETGRLYLSCAGGAEPHPNVSSLEDLPIHYLVSCDERIVAAHKAAPYDQALLLHHRQEGHFALSYRTADGWVAIKKDFITEILGTGRDAKIAGLSLQAAQALSLMCPNLAVCTKDTEVIE